MVLNGADTFPDLSSFEGFGFQQLTQVPGKALRRRPEAITVLISSDSH